MKSWKKATAFLATAAIMVFGTQLGLDEKTKAELCLLASSYILGQGIHDHGKAKASP
jgi:hypothetical protein